MAVEPSTTQSIQRFRINWVLINDLAIGPAPRAERHIQRLKAAGIHGVLSLCSLEEAKPPQGFTDQFQCQRILLPDHRSPEVLTLHQLKSSLIALSELRQQGPVFVHCVAAVERSPLICMAWLVQQQQLNPSEALDYLMQVHPGSNPLPRQLALLKQLNETQNQ
ncbi:dual specificity protein phosphatase family protein [Synechococcus sp. WH 8016]|uniref:protein-tyrosine phosphatase family protein n=1 Tax=Synechococcus sp. WH 8016 TaxID=166318 RepID=UPI00022D9EB5|nr:dual specificity protein phosphatase [Synechococcus sp. WH 8016]EHA62421.1 Dual specificity protein phosphatase [Synechococcus sp. WH 8016]